MERTGTATGLVADVEPQTSGSSRGQLSGGFLYALRFLSFGLIFAALFHDIFTFIDQRTLPLYDFASYYVPARALAQYSGINPYDFEALTRLNTSAHFITHTFFAFGYPPATLLLLRPLAVLPYVIAGHLWVGLSHLCAIATAILLGDAFAFVVRKNWQTTGPERNSALDHVHTIVEGTSVRIGRWSFPTAPVAICLAILLFAYPTASTYSYGQINLLVAFFLVLGFHAHLYNRPVLAGISIAIAGALKLSPLFMLVFFFVRGSWKALLWGLGVSVVLAGIPLVLISPQIFGQYSEGLARFDSSVVPLANNESLVGLFIQAAHLLHISTLLGQQVAQVIAVVLAIIAVGALLALAFLRAELLPWRRAPRASDQLDLDWLAYSLLLAVYLLITPLVWGHYYVIALPALLMLAAYPLLRRRAQSDGWSAVDGVVLLGSAIGLAFISAQLPLGADRETILASPALAMLLRSVRVLALLIIWGLSIAVLAPMLRRALSARATTSEQVAIEAH